MCGPGNEMLELSNEQKEEIQKLAELVQKEAELVVKDYEENPSEDSGSLIGVHVNSPLLDGDIDYSIGQEDDGEY